MRTTGTPALQGREDVRGEPPDLLLGHARTLFNALRADGVRLQCLGTTKAGWPKHSSRLAYATPIRDFVW